MSVLVEHMELFRKDFNVLVYCSCICVTVQLCLIPPHSGSNCPVPSPATSSWDSRHFIFYVVSATCVHIFLFFSFVLGRG